MFLDYGAVRLSVIDLTRFERDTVWTDDGCDLLYVRHTIGVTATYAPGGYPRLPSATVLSDDTNKTITPPNGAARRSQDNTLSVIKTNFRGADPGKTTGIIAEPVLEPDIPGSGTGLLPGALWHSGPETDAELRLRLLTPRQKLILWAYERQTGNPMLWVESPRPGYPTDVNNGPRPLSCDVVSAAGEPNSVVVHFQVQADLSPCPIGSDRVVLSHRWEMSHSHDENYYLTRTIKGQIVFNGGLMDALGERPDFLRAQFIHPIPVGFKRMIPEITQSSDGNTIRYTVTDTDPTITFDPGNSGATQMHIVERLVNSVERGTGGARFSV